MTEDAMLAGRYRRLSVLGAGGMGEVWLADDTVLHRQVAIKRLIAGMATDPEMVERMMREARVAARMDHPHAVTVHDVVLENGHPHLVMQYVAGRSLADLLLGGPLPVAHAGTLIGQVADALAHAHALRLIHRDVKPANVLIDSRGRALLADFGIARSAADGRLTGTGQFIGTPAYLAPEAARGEEAGPASDVYALGATLFAAVEGFAPHDDGSDNALALLSRVLTRPPPHPRRAGSLTGLLVAMLASDPAARPSARQVADELQQPVRADTPTVVSDPPEPDDEPLDSVLEALEDAARATGGWSGPLEEWERLLVDAVLPEIGPGDHADLFVPTMFSVRGRPTRAGTELRVGVTVTFADRLVCAWTTGGRSLRHASATIDYATVQRWYETTYTSGGVVHGCLALEGEGYSWPIVFGTAPEARSLQPTLVNRIRGAVQ